MLTHLISTTEFVKLVKDNSTSLTERSIANQYIQCLRYANFISQKPELWMFVPCDEDGNVLEEPKLPYEKATWCDKCAELNPDYAKWYNARSKVLFKGWKFVEKTKRGYYKLQKDDETTMYLDVSEGLLNGTGHSNTLEYMQFISTELLELTETALKQIL